VNAATTTFTFENLKALKVGAVRKLARETFGLDVRGLKKAHLVEAILVAQEDEVREGGGAVSFYLELDVREAGWGVSRTERRSRRERLTKDQVEAAKAEVLRSIRTTYDLWNKCGGAEPKLTVATVRENVDGHLEADLGSAYYLRLDREKDALVRGWLESMRAAGTLASSTGINWNGREARMYEPAGGEA